MKWYFLPGMHDWIIPFSGASSHWIEHIEHHNVVPATLGQYTGLLDKNGKRIFEGDIVTFKTSVYTFKPCVVEYSNAETRFVARIGDRRYAMTDSFVYEVIGNIYDHKELLDANEV